MTYKECLEKIKCQLQDSGLSETALMLGDAYSGNKKSALGSHEKQVKALQDQVTKLQAANDKKLHATPDNNNSRKAKTKPQAKRLTVEARKFLSETCRNWNLGLCNRGSECNRKHRCNQVVGDRICGQDHRCSDHPKSMTTTFKLDI